MEYEFDLKELEEQVKKVISYSQDIPMNLLNHVDNIINSWFAAKKLFIEHMQGKLIWEYPEKISFELNEDAKKSKLEKFAEYVETFYQNDYLANFLYNIKTDDFYNNKTSKDYYVGVRNETIIPANFKVVKSFKFFVDNKQQLKDIQNEASRIIQESVVKGTLCFSVHPLDFLSASENAHNWRSCHALDGDYRTGNLNYMLDNSTVICYLRADEDNYILPHFPPGVTWNSKKWRVWLFFSNDTTMMFAGRQYPFAADRGLEIIKDQILPTLKFDHWSKFSRDKIKYHEDSLSHISFLFSYLVPVGREAIPIKKLVIDGRNTFHYNDILNSHVYDPIYSYRSYSKWYVNENGTGMTDTNTRFIIGSSCPCPVCGEGEIDFSDIMVCSDCSRKYDIGDNDEYEECEICGSMVYYDDMITLDYSGTRVCPVCYEEETARCQNCGLVDLRDYIYYRQGDSRCLCEQCYEDIIL